MRVDPAEVAQHVQMQRSGLDGLGPALAQAVEVRLGGGELGIAQCGIFREQLARLAGVARHEDAECDPQRIHDALVER